MLDSAEHVRGNNKLIEQIEQGLEDYNTQQRPDPKARPVTLVLRDHDQVVGGLLGRIAWGWLRVDSLWVDARCRGQGSGRDLLAAAERIAVDAGCRGVHLDTFEFQAPGFYRKLGYECFGLLEDYPTPETHYYFKKTL